MSDSDETAMLDISDGSPGIDTGAGAAARGPTLDFALSPLSDVEIPAVSVWITTAHRAAAWPGDASGGKQDDSLAAVAIPSGAVEAQRGNSSGLVGRPPKLSAPKRSAALADAGGADGSTPSARSSRSQESMNAWGAFCRHIVTVHPEAYEAYRAAEEVRAACVR